MGLLPADAFGLARAGPADGSAASVTAAATASEAFAAAIRALAGAPLTARGAALARACILDWAGCAVAGADDAAVRALADELTTASDAPCTVIGRAARASVADAALHNGTAGDALDFSDCLRAMNGHATATVLPAALAQAEAQHASGAALVRAFVTGVETAARVGVLVGDGVLATPFHPTAVAGPFGAAAAVAVLLDLPADRWTAAFGIAATQAAGLADAVGTACKPLHAGLAAAAGVRAARLAAAGVGGPADPLGAGSGFLRAHTTRPQHDALAAARDRAFVEETLVKEHAACQLAHGSIANALALQRDHGFGAAQVAAIDVAVAASSARVCGIVRPATGLEAKFSLGTVVAMALLGIDTGAPASYDRAVHAADVAALAARVHVAGEEALPVALARMRIVLHDGRAFDATFDERRIDPDLDRRSAIVRRKFAALASGAVGPRRAAALEAAVAGLDELPNVGAFAALLAAPAEPRA